MDARRIAEKFWLADLGADHFSPGVTIQSHAASVEKDLGNRAVCFVSGDRVFVTAPAQYLRELQAAFDSEGAPIDIFISTMRGKGRIVGGGPAYVGYADYLSGHTIDVCSLDKTDSRVQMIAEAYPDDWNVFGLCEDSAGPFAEFAGDQIVGLSHYEIWGGAVAHIGVVTVPAARGRGVGERVVRQAAQEAIKRNLLPQYRTLWSNKPSIRIAERLGFFHYADTVFVRCGEG